MPPTKSITGVWGSPTSTLDWCEENYSMTPFIAEFWNTTSNWIMIIPPFLAAYYAFKDRIEPRSIAAFTMLGLIGVGSFMFHLTLLYEMQLLDELPMLYGSCAMLYCLLSYKDPESKTNYKLLAALTVIAVTMTTLYLFVPNPLVFQWCYGVLAGSIFAISFWTYKQHRAQPRLVFGATLGYLFGFILWNIDNNFCPQVRLSRSYLPGVVQPVTQLHAWWHFFAGGSSYVSLLYQLHLRLMFTSKNHSFQWCYKWLPLIRMSSQGVQPVSNGIQNKDSKNDAGNNNVYNYGFSKIFHDIRKD